MTYYSIEPKDITIVKGYGILSFAKYFSKNIGKNLTSKYIHKLLDHTKESATDALEGAVHSKYNFRLLESLFIKCWDRIFFSHEKVSIHYILLFFPLFYAHPIRDVTVGNLYLIYVIFKEKNIINEVARIKKILCCVKKKS